jgi:hypothetical protein
MDIPGIGNIANINDMLEKVKERLNFPVSKKQVVDVVDGIPGIPDQAKEWVRSRLPEGTYNGFDDLKKAVGL